jgi:hypothetical protein
LQSFTKGFSRRKPRFIRFSERPSQAEVGWEVTFLRVAGRDGSIVFKGDARLDSSLGAPSSFLGLEGVPPLSPRRGGPRAGRLGPGPRGSVLARASICAPGGRGAHLPSRGPAPPPATGPTPRAVRCPPRRSAAGRAPARASPRSRARAQDPRRPSEAGGGREGRHGAPGWGGEEEEEEEAAASPPAGLALALALAVRLARAPGG